MQQLFSSPFPQLVPCHCQEMPDMEEDGKNLKTPAPSKQGPLGSGDQGHLEAITLDLTPPQEVHGTSAGTWASGACSATYYLFLLSL